MIKIAFLDRDGTINKDYPDKEWKNGSIEGIKKLIEKGF